jgi:hypothetical protein
MTPKQPDIYRLRREVANRKRSAISKVAAAKAIDRVHRLPNGTPQPSLQGTRQSDVQAIIKHQASKCTRRAIRMRQPDCVGDAMEQLIGILRSKIAEAWRTTRA